ncbi:UNVERIFIED_CONTAM: hypothetical protein K2H54_010348 [Gekko kuhli]
MQGHDAETAFPVGEDEEDLDKTLSVERFGDLISKSVLRDQEKHGRSYSERDFEFHRQTSHHIHHPLSAHLPPPHKSQKRLLRSERKKKRKPKKTSVPPSNVTPTIQEVEEEEEGEEEAESEGEELLEKETSAESDPEASPKGESPRVPKTERNVEFTIGSDEEEEEEEEKACGSPCTLSFHVAEECSHLSSLPCLSDLLPEKGLTSPRGFSGRKDYTPRGWEKRKAWSQVPSGQRANYDLRERVCIGSMTTLESATYQRIPTDEAEAQMLASADLDDMKRISYRKSLPPEISFLGAPLGLDLLALAVPAGPLLVVARATALTDGLH